MKYNIKIEWPIWVLICVACWFFGASHGITDSHKEAASVGVGTYITNSGKSVFVWKSGTNLISQKIVLEIK
jgi:hypothetical protein